MRVINQTKKTTLAQKVLVPKSLIDQSLGLLKHKTPTAMLFRTRFGIHTFAMSYPIDVLILDKQNQVAVIKKDLKPNRIFVWNIKYKTILELPKGTIKKTKTNLQDKLVFYK